MLQVYLYSFLLVVLIQVLFFVFAAILRTDKFTDLAYGLTFVILAVALTFWTGTFYAIQLMLTLMVAIWGLRLAGYLFIRIIKTKRDKRFDKIRNNFFKFAGFWTLQAVTIFAVMLPTILVLSSKNDKSTMVFTVVGYMIWLIGFAIETVADYQKYQFKSKKENKDKWIETGVFRYSRYPNYFGEMTLWWGVFVMAIPFIAGWQWISVLGPVFITCILLFVSGIPPLERRYNKKYAKDRKYQLYKKRTSILIPFPPKKLK